MPSAKLIMAVVTALVVSILGGALLGSPTSSGQASSHVTQEKQNGSGGNHYVLALNESVNMKSAP